MCGASSALAYRKDSFFQSVKERLAGNNDHHACMNLRIAEVQPLFCKECFYHFKRQHELSAYLLYALTDWKKETAFFNHVR